MSKPWIEYHFKYRWHGIEQTGQNQYPVGTHDVTVASDNAGTEDFEVTHLQWPGYAWPGGYEMHYITKDGGVLCHQCANQELERTLDPDDDQFHIVGQEIHYEEEAGDHLHCDHCNRRIVPAYGDDE